MESGLDQGSLAAQVFRDPGGRIGRWFIRDCLVG